MHKLYAVAVTVGIIAFAAHAHAQTNTPVTPTEPEQLEDTEVIPQAPLPAPTLPVVEAPPPGEKPPTLEEVATMARAAAAVAEYIRIYGILRPIVSFAGRAVESFSNPNQSAPTAAANPALASLPNDSRLSFQVAQTRFGMWIGEKTPLRGHLEFDFIDFTRSSPTVQSLIRLRIATIEYDPIKNLTLIAGQDWDLFSPINAHGMNLVGTHFQSGNTGFMRNQLKVLYKIADKVEVGAAIGLQGANAAFRDASLELGRMPTFAVRAAALLGKLGRVGINGIATRLRLSPGPTERMTFAGAGGLYGELTPGETTQIRFEGYIGQNLANLGTLALSQATLANDIKEIGGFVSVRQTFLAKHAVYGSFGTAQVFNGGDVAPSYAYAATAMGTTPTLGSATLAGTGPGIRWNDKALIGYDYKPLKALAIGAEFFWFRTRHQLQEVDLSRISNTTRKSFGADVGMVYSF